jgi:hypothetical protein
MSPKKTVQAIPELYRDADGLGKVYSIVPPKAVAGDHLSLQPGGHHKRLGRRSLVADLDPLTGNRGVSAEAEVSYYFVDPWHTPTIWTPNFGRR